MDLIRQLGLLALASRLKRLSDRLMRDGSCIYREQGLEFEPRWFTVFYLLSQRSSLAVTKIARELRVSHPAVNQVANAMEKAGLLVSRKDKADERKRLLSLSPSGKALVTKLKPLWNDFKLSAGELLAESGVDLLEVLDRIENSLDDAEMYDRIKAQIKKRQLKKVKIIDYKPRYQKYFRTLNLEWLKKYFSVEPLDEKMLSHPEGEILRQGGRIFFAQLDGKIVGTVALIKHSDSTYEIAKMAVTERAQGRQAGKRLVLAAIEKARSLGGRTILLNTSFKLTAANNLYRQLGFVQLRPKPQPNLAYTRPTITLKLDIEALKKPKKHK
ncbi:MAG: bifunctional helix-turn-helix transcriptional regulator/GNAT family N-acetyltransferase [Candidatus Zixiibacteriota bacterium]